MKPPSNGMSGLSLLESLLVLAVGGTLLVMGMKIYNQWRQYADANQLSANVEQLFIAMRSYYQANCRQQLNPNGNTVSQGPLDPEVIGNATSLAITINSAASSTSNTDLFNVGFLNSTTWHPMNPLVDNTVTDNGYSLKFIRNQVSSADPAMPVYACAGASVPTYGPTYCTGIGSNTKLLTSSDTSVPTLQTKVLYWTAQVMVKVKTPNKTNAMKNLTLADCIIEDPTKDCTTGAVIVASPPAGSTYYLVWERPAAMLTENTTSPLWMSMPAVKQFNMQYTNDGMSALSGVNSNQTTGFKIKNYLCGG